MIRAEKAAHSVGELCRVLGVSRSGYYAWKGRPPSRRARRNEALVARIRNMHRGRRRAYGSPRVYRELTAQGESVSLNRVARVMRENSIQARRRRRFRKTTDSKHNLPVAENLLKRNFRTEKPDQAWVADISYVWTEEGWLYLAVVIDLFSRLVVGWSMADHLRTELPLAALTMALGQRKPEPGMIHHSDRGCQYASHVYRAVLAAAGITCSMSRKGDCWDNAVAESFFATFRAELSDHCRWETRDAARTAIHDFIERFYNRQRRHSYLGYISPVAFETLAEKQEPVAA
jgi:putative transposase